jgi:hypothetical protein
MAPSGGVMTITFNGRSGSTLLLDLTDRFGKRVEIDHLSFGTPPIEFRLLRNGKPITNWVKGTEESHDLQRDCLFSRWTEYFGRHTPKDPLIFDDPPHRHDILTSGLLTTGLAVETRADLMNSEFSLLVRLREFTYPAKGDCAA